MRITDLKDMPGFNPMVTNGTDSVSRGRVSIRQVTMGWLRWTERERLPIMQKPYPHCIRHGAMNKVSADGIWRCLQLGCNAGCFELPASRYQ